jgi:hypothetical protein
VTGAEQQAQQWRTLASVAERVFRAGITWAAERDVHELRSASDQGLRALETADGEALVLALVAVGHYGRELEVRRHKAFRANLRRASQKGSEKLRKVRDPVQVVERLDELKAQGRRGKEIDGTMRDEFGIGLRQALNYRRRIAIESLQTLLRTSTGVR